MVLAHRRRRQPFDAPGMRPEEIDDAWDRALRAAEPDDERTGDAMTEPDDQLDEASGSMSMRLPDTRRPRRTNSSSGRFGLNTAERGRFVRQVPVDPESAASVDGRATAVALAARRAASGDPAAPLIAQDLRSATREQRSGTLVVLVVDASGSMGIEHRMAATKAAVLGLLGDAYRRRGRVALIAFRGSTAEVVLRPTASIEIARARLQDIRTGGTSPLAAGINTACDMLSGETGDRALDPTVVIVTDGRATEPASSGGLDPLAAAFEALHRLAATGARVVLVDTETGRSRLGHVAQLAASIAADHVALDSADPTSLERAVRRVSVP
jgi:magnesium chelatase subunit D